ncbi:hypothetical protein LOD99_10126 [Oopsacas minuta]|uniref:Phosphodiesterase n=1 Tax=Oopsacas minuta TaxID=111878 RepID=A0AAV7KJN6_9METZ|nr:hypothetical protein LOD99_10126 [Oopsacas minuta]
MSLNYPRRPNSITNPAHHIQHVTINNKPTVRSPGEQPVGILKFPNSLSSLSPEEVEQYLQTHPDFARHYYMYYYAPSEVDQLSSSRPSRTRRLFSRKKGTSINKSRWSTTHQPTIIQSTGGSGYSDPGDSGSPTSESSNTSYLRSLGSLPDHDLLIELVKDIASDLDLVMLCTKIMRNVSPLMNADRSSLFLVEGTDTSRRLVSKVFDISEGSSDLSSDGYHSDSSFPEVTIGWGTGIVGHVAKTGETVSIPDAYQDDRFNKEVDEKTGYLTKSVLCMPVKIESSNKKDSFIIGVAMAINKSGPSKSIVPFSTEDEKIFAKFLTFCGIGIRNAQRFERVQEEEIFKHNLLNMAELLYNDFSSMETFAKRIMEVSYEMLDCERCTVYVLKERTGLDDDTTFSEVYTYEPDSDKEFAPEKVLPRSKSKFSIRRLSATCLSVRSGLVYDVARTGNCKNLNLRDMSPLSESCLEMDNIYEGDTNVLMMPICCRGKEIVGVAQFVNRSDKNPFNEVDESNFATFAIFCGLGIKHINDFERARTLLAQQKVTIEQLTYHIVASEEDVKKLSKQMIPSAGEIGLIDFDYYLDNADDENSILYAVSMFQSLGLVRKFSIDQTSLIKFLLTLQTGGMSTRFTDLEKLALMIASFAHDVDHRGTNNKYQQEFDTPLYNLYNTSTMEHHHYKHCALILQCEDHQILSGLSKEQYSTILSLLQKAILATDLAVYFEKRVELFQLIKDNKFDDLNSHHKQLLLSMLMTAADLSSITKPFDVQYRVAHHVAEEFWQQGDIEREKLGQAPHPIMDRQKKSELPKLQVGFIDGICLPLYQHLAQLNKRLYPLLDGCNINRAKWVQLDDEHCRNSLAQKIHEDSRHW